MMAGRFERPANVRLRNVMQWLDQQQVLPADVRLQTWLAFGFLLVCVVNMVGLDRKSTRLNSSHTDISRMPSSA